MLPCNMSAIDAKVDVLVTECDDEVAVLERALAAARLKKARKDDQPQLPTSLRPVEPDGWSAIEHGKVACTVAAFENGSSSRVSGSSATPSTPSGSELAADAAAAAEPADVRSAKSAKRLRQKEAKKAAASTSSTGPTAAAAAATAAVEGEGKVDAWRLPVSAGTKPEAKATAVTAVVATAADAKGEGKGVAWRLPVTSGTDLAADAGVVAVKGKKAPKRGVRTYETWPQVSCDGDSCSRLVVWRQMFEKHIRVSDGGSGRYGDDADPEYSVLFFCCECMGKEWGLSPPAALARILEERPGFAKRCAANTKFLEADAKVAEAIS